MPVRRLAVLLSFAVFFSGPAPLLAAQKPAPVHVATAVLDRYVGQYREQDEPDIVLSVFRDGDRLYIESARTARLDLTAKSNTSFAPDSTPLYLSTDASGAVTAMKFAAVGSPESTLTRISSTPVSNHFRPYSREEVMIPMRDGVKLHAVLLRPTDTKEPLPFLMQRTPYGVDGYDSDGINARYTELAQSGYIFVMEDIRGRYKSEGKFVMMRPLADHSDAKAQRQGRPPRSTKAPTATTPSPGSSSMFPTTTAASASWASPIRAFSPLKRASTQTPPFAPSRPRRP